MSRSILLALAGLAACSGGDTRSTTGFGMPTTIGGGSTGEGTGSTSSVDPSTSGDASSSDPSGGPSTGIESSSGASTTGEPDDGMVPVPAGPFLMGCNIEPNCWADEEPLHEITLSAFRIDRTEIARGDYLMCIDAGTCTAPSADFDGTTDATLPVVWVTWEQADAYCAWQGKRLPTEAEWEKAARGTEGATYPWGMATPDCTLVNYAECGNAPIPVDSLPAGASPYGALQMSGNVWEWVADWYGETYYAQSPAVDPPGPPDGTDKIHRGGAFATSTGEIARLSVARRYIDVPTGSDRNRGFRCARSGE